MQIALLVLTTKKNKNERSKHKMEKDEEIALHITLTEFVYLAIR